MTGFVENNNYLGRPGRRPGDEGRLDARVATTTPARSTASATATAKSPAADQDDVNCNAPRSFGVAAFAFLRPAARAAPVIRDCAWGAKYRRLASKEAGHRTSAQGGIIMQQFTTGLLMAGSLGLLATALPVSAQQPAAPAAPTAAAPLPPGSPLIGRPEGNAAAGKLAPVRRRRSPTAADKLPLDKLKARTASRSRSTPPACPTRARCALGDKGTVFVGSACRTRCTPSSTRTESARSKVICSGLHRPNGVAFKRDALHRRAVADFQDREDRGQARQPAEADRHLLGDLPKDEAARLEISRRRPRRRSSTSRSARPATICMPSERTPRSSASVSTARASKSYATGIRQDRRAWTGIRPASSSTSPRTRRDWLSEDVPEGQAQSRHQSRARTFGYPYCHQGNFTDPEFGWGRQVQRIHQAGRLLGPARGRARHASSIPATMFPERISQPDLPGAPRLLEPQREDRRRRRLIKLNGDGSVPVDVSVHHRLHPETTITSAGRWTSAHEGRLDAGFRRLQRRGLSRQLRQCQEREPLEQSAAFAQAIKSRAATALDFAFERRR